MLHRALPRVRCHATAASGPDRRADDACTRMRLDKHHRRLVQRINVQCAAADNISILIFARVLGRRELGLDGLDS